MPQYTLSQLAESLSATLHGNGDKIINGLGTIERAKADQLTFLDNPLYHKYLESTAAGAVILTADLAANCPVDCLVVSDPYFAYATAATLFDKKPKPAAGIDKAAIVSQSAKIAATAHIGAHCVIGDDVSIGEHTIIEAGTVIGQGCQIADNSRLHSNVTLYHNIIIGSGVVIHSGCVLGADGFGLAKHQGRWHEIAQIGGVVIADNVSIGANTTIDSGAIEPTFIAEGVKLDNQIQIGHNVKIGKHTAVAGCAAIAGSTEIGEHCIIGGGACFAGHLTITDNVTITGMAGVSRSINQPGMYSSGLPIQPNAKWRRGVARYRQLEDLSRRIKQLERQLAEQTACEDNN